MIKSRLHNGIREISLSIFTVGLIFVISGCGAFSKMPKMGGEALCSQVPEAIEAKNFYTNNIYPLVRTPVSGCVNCHGPGRSNDNGITSDSSGVAYAATLMRLAPVNQAENTVFYVRSTNGHCATCNQTNIPGWNMMEAHIRNWAAKEVASLDAIQRCAINSNSGGNNNPSPSPSPSNSPAVNNKPYKVVGAPVNLDTLFQGVAESDVTTTRTMTFNLTNYGVAATNNVNLSFSIRRFSVADGATPGSFLVFNPRITIPAGGRALFLADLETSIASGSDKFVSDLWTTVSAQLPVAATNVQISNRSDVMVRPANANNVFTLRLLTAAEAAGGCRNLTNFQTNVVPVVTNRCTSCHAAGSNNAAARGRWTMNTANVPQLCDNFKTRILGSNTTAVLQSFPIVFPTTGNFNAGNYTNRTGHPNIAGQFVAAERNLIVNWFAGE